MGRYKGSNCNAGVLDRDAALRSLENGSIKEMPPYFTGRGIGKGYTCVAFRQGEHSARRRGGEGDKVWAALSACPSAMDGMRRDADRRHFPRVSVSSPGAERCRAVGQGAIQGAAAMRCFGARRGGSWRYVFRRIGAYEKCRRISQGGASAKDIHALRFDRESIARAGGVEKAIRFGRHFRHAPPQWMACALWWRQAGMRRDADRRHFPRVSVSSPGAERCRALGHGAIQGATAMRVFWSATRRVVSLLSFGEWEHARNAAVFHREGHRQRIYMRCVSTE